MRYKHVVRFLILTIGAIHFVTGSAPAQWAVEAWVQRYNYPADTASDRAIKLATDNDGNVIVVGNSNEGATASDIVVIKYSGVGTALWTNRYNGSGDSTDEATGLAVGSEGQVFVTGSSDLREQGGADYVTLAYSAAGVPLWTNRYDGPIHSNDVPSAIAVDAADNVFVTGWSFGNGGGRYYATIKYSRQGIPLWTRCYNRRPDGHARANSLAVDGNGNVVVTGWAALANSNVLCVTLLYASTGEALWTNLFDGFGSQNNYSTAAAADSSGNVVVTGYSIYPAANWAINYASTGVPLWANSFHGRPEAVAVDRAGNAFVTGSTEAGYERTDYLTVAYSASGLPLWTNTYHGSCTVYCYDTARAITVKSNGDVVVTGHATSGGTRVDYATIAYSGAGMPLWTNVFDGSASGNDYAQAVAVDGTGTVFVTGYSEGGGYDFATVAYSAVGVPCWTNRYAGVGNEPDTAAALAVDTGGRVFVTGTSRTPGGPYESVATIAYSSEGVPLWTNFFADSLAPYSRAIAIGVGSNGNVVVTGHARRSATGADFATIAYTQEGLPLWTNTYNGPADGADNPSDMALDANGTIFVTGSSAGFDGFADYVTIAYEANGTPLWTNRHHRFYDDVPTAIAVDSLGTVFVTGKSYSGLAYEDYDYLTIAYSNCGTPLWTNLYQGSGNRDDSPSAIAVDSARHVIVTGYSERRPYHCDFTTVAYSANGVPLWTNRLVGVEDIGAGIEASGAFGRAIAVDENQNVFVAGYSYRPGGVNPDYVTISYSSTGAPRWTNYYNGPGDNSDLAASVKVDCCGNVIVTGYSDSGGYNYDYATVFYSNDGVPLSTNRYDGPVKGYENISGKRQIAVGVDGSVYVAGTSEGEYGHYHDYDFATVKYGVSPCLLAEATNRIAPLGDSAAFSVKAYGTGPLTYLWMFNGTFLHDQTNNVLTIPDVTGVDEGEYTVVVSSPYGSVTNPIVTLMVHMPLQFRSIDVLPDGTVYVSFIGTSHFAYRIEASSNFLDWVVVGNTVSSNAVFDFIDPGPANDRQRFYRAVYP